MKTAATPWGLEDILKALLPTLSALLFVLIAMLPYGVPRLSIVMPWLGLMPVYYWSINEPRYMPYAAAFLVGLWQDMVSGGPLGLCALIFLLVRHFVVNQRLVFYKKPFLVTWWGFGLVSFLAVAGGWVLASLYFGRPMAVPPFIAQAALSTLVYPLVAWIMGGIWLVVSR